MRAATAIVLAGGDVVKRLHVLVNEWVEEPKRRLLLLRTVVVQEAEDTGRRGRRTGGAGDARYGDSHHNHETGGLSCNVREPTPRVIEVGVVWQVRSGCEVGGGRIRLPCRPGPTVRKTSRGETSGRFGRTRGGDRASRGAPHRRNEWGPAGPLGDEDIPSVAAVVSCRAAVARVKVWFINHFDQMSLPASGSLTTLTIRHYLRR